MSLVSRLMLTLVATLALAQVGRAADVDTAVVQIQSKVCSGGNGVFKGSGLLFKQGSSAYVLTSEHVVLHARAGYCHRAFKTDQTWLDLDLMRVDFAYGLALLKVTAGDVPAAAPRFDDLEWRGAAAGETVVSAGFPAGSDRIYVDPASSVRTPDSARHLFPGIERVVEMVGHGEFGMSGGPVFADQGRRIVGVLSHQYLEVVTGDATIVRAFGRGSSQLQINLLLIPATVAHGFVADALNAPGGVLPFFLRDPAAQYAEKDVVHAAGLRFEFVKGPDQPGHGGDGGIGGIGGVNPVGIGGADEPGDEFNQVRVSLSRIPDATRWYLPATSVWVDRVKRKLVGRDFLTIDFLANQNQRVPFGSLAKFFIAMAHGARPVIRLDPSQDPVLPEVQRLMAKGRELGAKAETLVAREDLELARILLQNIKSLADILSSGEWELVSMTQLDELTQPAPAWDAAGGLFDKAFDDAIALQSNLDEARQILESLILEGRRRD